MKKAISDTPGNPAHALKQAYNMLMILPDPATLAELVLEIVQETGISPKNHANFKRVIASNQHSLTKLQSYITNFILKADGHGVI